MKRRLTACGAKRFSVYVLTEVIANSAIPGSAEAMFVPAAPKTQSKALYDRTADLAKIQRALESKTLQHLLMNYWLSPGRALDKINRLLDEQIHQFATHIYAVQARGMRSSDLDSFAVDITDSNYHIESGPICLRIVIRYSSRDSKDIKLNK